MNTEIRERQRGFTLVEMIMVVSIILFLLGTLVVFVSNAHLESQKQETRKIVDGLESALVNFYDEYGAYPKLTGGTPVAQSASLYAALSGSGTVSTATVTFTGSAVAALGTLPAGAGATDPTYGPYLVDAWHNPIVCVVFAPGSTNAEANGGMPFIYSCGPDGQCSGGYGTSLPPPTSNMDADNISNFRDLPTGTWGY